MADSEADTASIISASTNASTKGRSSSRHKSSKSDKDKEKETERTKPSRSTKAKKYTDEQCESNCQHVYVKASTLQNFKLTRICKLFNLRANLISEHLK